MQDTGQPMDAGQLLQGIRQRDMQLNQLHAQLRHFQAWTASLATTAMQPLGMQCMLAAIQVLVSGFPENATERELALFFNDLIATHGAAVAPGPAVSDCKFMRGSRGVAMLELRCSVEASNCMAFDGVQFRNSYLKIQRSPDYRADAAILLGPCQPDPAVIAAVAHSTQQQHRSIAVPFADQGQYVSNGAASGPTSWQHAGTGVSAGDTGRCYPNSMIPVREPVPTPAESGGSHAAGQDLTPAADQSKQDEVFIGGLPSHWKAQQVKDLLAPYGPLKSLSVAMDAATGKNKGYAFVVFADSVIVPQAIEQLDCKVVEGKILAVQRATEGKAACAASFGKESSSHMVSAMSNSFRIPGGQPMKQHAQQQHLHHQRVSSCSSSGSSSVGGFVPFTAAADTGPNPAIGHSGVPMSNGIPMQQRQQRHPAAPMSHPYQPQHLAVRPSTAGASHDGAALGQRLLAAVTAGAAGSANASKQYDVNELYIGDLPLSWDEDAVRRLLGRYGKIKYFTLRSGRDKNFAFCKFKDSSVVDAAISGLHGKIVDGYFLNVRRAIEGKQQQQQQQWQGRQGPSGPGRGPTLSKFGQLQQQRPRSPRTSSFNSGSKTACMDNMRPFEHQKDALDVPAAVEADAVEAVAVEAGAVDLGGAAPVVDGQQQGTGSSTTSTAPSPPRTPTAAALQEQAADEVGQQPLGEEQQQQPEVQNLNLASQQPQQQQLQPAQPSLFLNSSGPASWGAPGLFTAAYHQQQQLQQSQHQSSLLQTWDMLSPWSLFSGNAQKVQW